MPKKMKVALATLAVATIALTGCAGGGAENNRGVSAAKTGGKPTVLTTFTVLADIAENVAGDHLSVESITKPGAEIHGYEPTPGDIAKASKADLILDNGLNLESWFKQFVDSVDAPHVVVSEGVKPIDITEDAYAGKPNPHAWMSPSNVEIYADNMAEAFADLDPKHADEYRENAENYGQQLRQVKQNMQEELQTLPKSQRALVTCEGAFSYLTRDVGLKEKYIWAVNAESQATPKQIASAIRFVKDSKVPAVFCESTVSDKAMKQVVEATDATFGGTLYVDSLSTADGPVPTYLELIKHDADTVTKALKGENTTSEVGQ